MPRYSDAEAPGKYVPRPAAPKQLAAAKPEGGQHDESNHDACLACRARAAPESPGVSPANSMAVPTGSTIASSATAA